MKNIFLSLLFSLYATALFLPSDLSATKNKKSDVTDITPEEQEALNAKLLLTAHYNRLESSLKLVELGADLDAHNEQEKSPREMLEEALRKPESPIATHQQAFNFNEQPMLTHALCFASQRAVNGREIEAFLRKREIRNKLQVLINQKKRSVEQTSSIEHVLPKLAIDTKIEPVVSRTNQLSSYPVTPTSPSNPDYRPALCCAAHKAVRSSRS